MALVRKKQDDKNLKNLREIGTINGNRQCFDCGQKGPTYVNMTIGSFVCTRCSGVLRGLTPPHRVKSISMATFSTEELEFLKEHGNDVCAKTWLGLWDPKRIIHQDQRELMIDKYERKRYFLEPASPLKSLTNVTTKINGNLNHNNSISSNNSSNSMGSNSSINSSKTNDTSKNYTLTPPQSRSQQQQQQNGGGGSVVGLNGLLNTSSQSRQDLYNNVTLLNGLNGQQQKVVNDANKSTKMVKGENLLNGFTPDSDFVADFSSANIFNANNLINNGSIPNGNRGGDKLVNENFADFEHAPIYNAAVQETNLFRKCDNYFPPFSTNTSSSNFFDNTQNNIKFNNSNIINSNNNNSTNNSTMLQSTNNNVQNNSSYYSSSPFNTSTNLKSDNLNNQNFFNQSLNDNYNSNNKFNWSNQNFNNELKSLNFITSQYHQQQQQQGQGQEQDQQRWNVCQQNWPNSSFDQTFSSNQNLNQPKSWSYSPPTNNITSPNSFTTNSKLIASPPSADRYAALKDLDELFRETFSVNGSGVNNTNGLGQNSNVSATSVFDTNFSSSNGGTQQTINPFKAIASAGTNNPFEPVAFDSQQFLLQQQQQLFNNGFGSNTNFGLFSNNTNNNNSNNNNSNNNNNYNSYLTNSYTNGCGFSTATSLQQQQIATGANVKNPFVTNTFNSNNPFL